ncbi:MAG: BTAD domain-containing putative transcriptional regulator [Vicinamibacterales bacterium]
MSIKVLGPLEVGDGAPLRGARERRLLGLLALHAPQPISRGTAMAWLLGDEDQSDDAALAVSVSRLRRQLRLRDVAASIDRSPAGLHLSAADGLVDVQGFVALADRGASTAAPAERARLLGDALRLWRGPILAGEDVPADPTIAALDERRLSCIEDRFAAELDADTVENVNNAVVGELVAAWRANRERERLCGLSMVALYRAGRQLEALDLFRDLRDELTARGLAPSARLFNVESAILRHDLTVLHAAQSDPVKPTIPTSPVSVAATESRATPEQLTSFVGRRAEQEALIGLLDHHRLVTISGPGGVGKTRLAVHAAADLRREGDAATVLVDLASVGDPGLLATVFAEAVNAPGRSARAPREAMIDELVAHGRLIIVDNCEHLVEEVADLVHDLLVHAPGLRVLATSREPLHVEGEHVMALWPLPITGPDGEDGPATQLFVQRAAAAGSSLGDDEVTRASIRSLVSRLDGLPLAIELAAARTRSLSVPELEARLEHRFRLLTGGPRQASARQRTLEATVAWSYDLLEPAARRLFELVSVFVGGFELDAATQLVGGDELDILTGLDQLVDRSLLNAVSHPTAPTRFSMLETMRQFGRERLLERDELAEVRDRHLRWLVELAATLSPELQLSVPPALARVDRELANLRLGFDWASQDAVRAAVGIEVCLALGRYWYQRGITAEAARWLDVLAGSDPELDDPTRAQVLCDLGFYLLQAGQADAALEPLERCLDLARTTDDDALLTRALHYQTRAGLDLRPPELLLARIEEGLDIARRIGDALHTYLHEVLLTIWHVFYGDPADAQRVGACFVRDHRASPSPHIAAHVVETAAWLALLDGDPARAAADLEFALRTYDALANPGCTCHALEAFAWWLAISDEQEQAAAVLTGVTRIRARDHHHRAVYESVPYRGATAALGAAHRPVAAFDELATGIAAALTRLSRSADDTSPG